MISSIICIYLEYVNTNNDNTKQEAIYADSLVRLKELEIWLTLCK